MISSLVVIPTDVELWLGKVVPRHPPNLQIQPDVLPSVQSYRHSQNPSPVVGPGWIQPPPTPPQTTWAGKALPP